MPAAAATAQALFLGRYRPLRPLGSGASGAVWLALDEQTGREVTVKVVTRAGKSGPRAQREASVLTALEHPRCVRAIACGRDAANVYIAYEYVPGRTLREALRSRELNDADAIEAAAQVLDALAHAHGRGILHRDVKPANVLLADEPGISVRLLDFGLARVAEADTLTGAGDVPGTLAYIAPERLRGADASPAADVWSVGVLLHEALGRRHPFWRPSLAETADAIAAGAPSLAELRPDLPRALVNTVDRALALRPEHRPSAAKLAKRLRTAGDGSAVATAGAAARRFVPPALAGVYAAVGATLLPFYPAHWAAPLAASVAALAYARPRAGLAAALAVPVLPLGNAARALALLYAALALLWFTLHAREPERGMLAPLGVVPGAVPFGYRGVRSPVVRLVGAAGAVLAAAAALSLRHGVGALEGAHAPLAAAREIALATPLPLALEALGIGLAALVLPWAARRGRWAVTAWGASTLALALLPVPVVPLAAGAWFAFGAVLART